MSLSASQAGSWLLGPSSSSWLYDLHPYYEHFKRDVDDNLDIGPAGIGGIEERMNGAACYTFRIEMTLHVHR